MTKRRGFWLWLGIILLSFSAVLWLGLIGLMATEPGSVTDAIVGGIVTTVPLIAFGVYCLVRARRLRAAEERNREQLIATRPQTPPAPDAPVARRTRWRAPPAMDGAWEWILGFVAVAGFFGLLIVPGILGVPGWLRWLAVLVAFAWVVVVMWLAKIAGKRRKRRLKEKGFGIESLQRSGARVEAPAEDSIESIFVTSDRAEFTLPDRQAVVDAIRADPDYVEVPTHTRVRVYHKGRIPCVVQMGNSGSRQIQFFDRDIWIKWTKGVPFLERVLKLPKKVKIEGRKVRTAAAEETVIIADAWARRILHDRSVAAIGGTIRIEPNQVVWWTRGCMLSQEMLKGTVDVLVDVARKLESAQEY